MHLRTTAATVPILLTLAAGALHCLKPDYDRSCGEGEPSCYKGEVCVEGRCYERGNAPDPADTSVEPDADTGAADTGTTDGWDGGDTASPDADTGPSWPSVDAASCGTYVETGPHTVGVTTLQIDGLDVEVWYPARPSASEGTPASYDIRNWLPEDERDKVPDEKAPRWQMNAYRDAPSSSEGPFPLVLFSHGLAGYRMQSSFLTVHLASWGHVVASADHPGRTLSAILEGDRSSPRKPAESMQTVWDELAARSNQNEGRFAGVIDPFQVAVLGHSAGARTAAKVALQRDVDAYVGYAGGPADTSEPVQTSGAAYLMGAEKDDIVPPDQVRDAWDAITGPKRYLEVADAGHLVFSDICLIGRDRGGVLEIADRHGVDVPQLIKDLGTDGCGAWELPPELAWPMIRHATTAHLVAAFDTGGGASDQLGAETFECFDGLVQRWSEENFTE